jgi:hypothetical protein
MTEAVFSDDGMDAAEMLQAIEAAFAIRISNDEATQIRRVGDLYDLISSKVKVVDRGQLPCLTAMAFRRIKKALHERLPHHHFLPETPLRQVTRVISARPLLRQLAADTGLRMPDPVMGLSGLAAMALTFVVLPLCLYQFDIAPPVVSGLLGIALTFLIARFWPVDLPRNMRNVGDLARSAAARNIAALSGQDEAVRTSDVWAALDSIIREIAARDAPIGRETPFFRASRFK